MVNTTCGRSGSMSFLSVSRPWPFPSVSENDKRSWLKGDNFYYGLISVILSTAIPAAWGGGPAMSGWRTPVWFPSINRRGTSFLDNTINEHSSLLFLYLIFLSLIQYKNISKLQTPIHKNKALLKGYDLGFY